MKTNMHSSAMSENSGGFILYYDVHPSETEYQ